ncbi:TPA: hypothetical protein EYN65_02690 [Candidatus Poribacteria bacterium]|nr:hypothetical protein [Candidatus Poribacteria bacterium]
MKFRIGERVEKGTGEETDYPHQSQYPIPGIEPVKIVTPFFEACLLRWKIIRRLDLGHLPIGTYYSRDRSAYWDGQNQIGERVSSGVYW